MSPHLALMPCGTNAAYSRHIKAGEAPCEECLAAHADYYRGYIRCRNRALQQLREMYPVSFARLLERQLEELDRYGIKSAH